MLLDKISVDKMIVYKMTVDTVEKAILYKMKGNKMLLDKMTVGEVTRVHKLILKSQKK
jgi:hypothetical protein